MFFTTSGQTCMAYDLRTLKARWTFAVPGSERGAYLLVVGDTVFLTTEADLRGTKSGLYALDAKTGRKRWALARGGKGSAMAEYGGTLYVSLAPGKVSAVEIASRRAKWTRALPGKREGDEVESMLAAGEGIALNAGDVTYGLDLRTGAMRWQEPKSYILEAPLVATKGTVWVPSGEGAVARSLASGKPLWRTEDSFSEFGGVLNGNFVGLDNGYLRAFEPKTGRPLWSHRLGPGSTSGGSQYGAILGGRLYVAGIDRSGVYDAKGKVLWSGKTDSTHPAPCWSDGRNLVAFDGHRLIRYVRGTEAALPDSSTGRQALARKMVARFGDLDAADLKRLGDLKDDAFPALFEAYRAACKAHDALPKGKDTYSSYSRYHDIGEMLQKVTTAKRAAELMRALDRGQKNSAAPLLLTLLARHGDPKATMPYFLRVLEDARTPGFEMYESNTYVAREVVKASSDPRAVAFMLRQLQHPKADPTLRFEAYANLPRTGGEAGRAVVRAVRAGRTLLPSLSERVLTGYLGAGEFGAKPKVIGEKKDAQGKIWGLLESGALGSSGDLWLVEKVDGEWANPVFTGVSSLGVSRWTEPKPAEPMVGGKTGAELAKSDWVSILATNAEIRKDEDGDGLTDLVEARLATDSRKADTDGDGDSDAVDPWPNAAARPETDEEKVLAAVFDARYFLNRSAGPALVYVPKGMKPFEMPGRQGVSLWASGEGGKWSLPVERCYGQGIGLVTFIAENRAKPDQVIAWNKDRTAATVGISIYYGGLNGTGYTAQVQKFGDEWFVTSLRMAFIS
jgi:outer membrane protein assembly factor BamB